MSLMVIPIGELKPRKNYRHQQDDQSFKELVASVKTHNILTPIIVSKTNGHYEVVAGQRRYMAAKEAGLTEIPCTIVAGDDPEFLATVSIVENVQRLDVNPMDEAEEFSRLIMSKEKEVTAKTIAEKIGKSVAYVQMRLRLQGLSEKAKEAVRNESLPLSHAVVMARLSSHAEMDELLKEILDKKGLRATLRETSDAVRTKYGLDLQEAIFDKAACKNCPSQTKNQTTLFPEDAKAPAVCLVKDCFINKTIHWLDGVAKPYADAGIKIISKYADYVKLMQQNNQIVTFDSKYSNTPKPKSFKENCEHCEDLFFIRTIDERFSRVEAVTGFICNKRSCYNKLTAKTPTKKDEATKASEKAQAAAVSVNKLEKAIDLRDRNIDRMLPEKMKQHPHLYKRLALFHLCVDHLKRDYVKHDNKYEPGFELLGDVIEKRQMKKYDTMDEFVMAAIMKIPAKNLDTMLKNAAIASLKMTTYSTQLLMTIEAGINWDKDVVMDEAFVNTMIKADLPEFAEKLKLDKPAIGGHMKKEEMVKAILPQLKAGMKTKEIQEACKVTL